MSLLVCDSSLGCGVAVDGGIESGLLRVWNASNAVEATAIRAEVLGVDGSRRNLPVDLKAEVASTAQVLSVQDVLVAETGVFHTVVLLYDAEKLVVLWLKGEVLVEEYVLAVTGKLGPSDCAVLDGPIVVIQEENAVKIHARTSDAIWQQQEPAWHVVRLLGGNLMLAKVDDRLEVVQLLSNTGGGTFNELSLSYEMILKEINNPPADRVRCACSMANGKLAVGFEEGQVKIYSDSAPLALAGVGTGTTTRIGIVSDRIVAIRPGEFQIWSSQGESQSETFPAAAGYLLHERLEGNHAFELRKDEEQGIALVELKVSHQEAAVEQDSSRLDSIEKHLSQRLRLGMRHHADVQEAMHHRMKIDERVGGALFNTFVYGDPCEKRGESETDMIDLSLEGDLHFVAGSGGEVQRMQKTKTNPDETPKLEILEIGSVLKDGEYIVWLKVKSERDMEGVHLNPLGCSLCSASEKQAVRGGGDAIVLTGRIRAPAGSTVAIAAKATRPNIVQFAGWISLSNEGEEADSREFLERSRVYTVLGDVDVVRSALNDLGSRIKIDVDTVEKKYSRLTVKAMPGDMDHVTERVEDIDEVDVYIVPEPDEAAAVINFIRDERIPIDEAATDEATAQYLGLVNDRCL